MKRFIIIFAVLLSAFAQGYAQQYLNVYQDAVVINQISSNEIDSISVSETEPRIISLWRDGEIAHSYTSAEIDSITVTNKGGAPFSYIGVVGFNDTLYVKDVSILSSSTAGEYKAFVNSLPYKNGTLLYYAVDNALNMLDSANIATPLKYVNLITFTDGLDQGSLMVTDGYKSSVDYLTAMSDRITKATTSGLPVNAFCVGLQGKDVTNVQLFRQNIERLASSPENAYEVSTIRGLQEKLREIADQIISVSNRQTVSVKVPGIDSGTQMRFVFDGKQAEESELYIEGRFNLQDRSLHDVTYHGIKATSGDVVQGTQSGIFVTYTFTGMRKESGCGLIPTSSIRHYYRMSSESFWQENSEFTQTNNTQTSISHSGTAIFLILDCSSSLGDDFVKMKSYANEFIDMVSRNAEPFNMAAPRHVNAEVDDSTMFVHVSWDADKYAQGYNVYRRSGNNGNYELIAENVLGTSWSDELASPGVNYYKVSSLNRNIISQQSDYSYVDLSISSPRNVKVEVVDSDLVVNVSWDAVRYAKSYNVYRSNNANGNYELVAENVEGTTWTDTKPLRERNYYRVSAVNRDITSPLSSSSYVYVSLDTPSGLKASLSSKDDHLVVNIVWEAVKYAKSYNVYRSDGSNDNYELVAENLSGTSWADDYAKYGSNYYYRVSAINHSIISAQSSSLYVNVKLDTPTNLETRLCMKEGYMTVDVSWKPVEGAQSYYVFRNNHNNNDYEKISETVDSTSWTDLSPKNGDNYYRVCALIGDNVSAQSKYSYVNCTLSAPANIKTEVVDSDLVVNVSWDAHVYAVSYNVYRSSNSREGYEIIAENVTTNSWTDRNPKYGENYYRVSAVNNTLTSQQSSYASAKIYLGTPSEVRAELGVKNEKFVTNVSWKGVKSALCYNVYRNSSSGDYVLVAENIPETMWTDETVKYGNSYNYRITAVIRSVVSGQSSTASVNVRYTVPTNIRAKIDENDLVVNVTWDATPCAQAYHVYRKGKSGDYVVVAENVKTTLWTDTNPLSGYNYYRVCAVGYGFSSDQSSNTSVNVTLNQPVNVKTAIAIKNDRFVANISWDAVKYAQKYNVYRSNSSSGSYVLAAENVTGTSWTDETPQYSQIYYYRVNAVNRAIASSQSNYGKIKIELSAPEHVKAVIDESDLVVNVSWDTVNCAQSYQVYHKNQNGVYELAAENVTTTSWTDTTPLSGYNYYYVKASGYGQTSPQSSSTSINVNIGTPQNVKAALAVRSGKFVADISWDAVNYAQAYNVYRKTNGSYELVAKDVASTSWTDAVLTYGEYCYYRVCAINRSIIGSQSNNAGVYAGLETPKNVNAVLEVSNEKIVIGVTWDAVQFAQGYNVYRNGSSGGNYELVAENVKTNSWTDMTPLQGDNYYRVCATGYDFTTPFSSYKGISVMIDAPRNVKAQIEDDDLVVKVKWEAVAIAQGYNVYRRNGSGKYELMAENITTTFWRDTTPLPGYNYYYVIASGYGQTSPQSSSTSINVNIGTPQNLKAALAVRSGKFVADISWDAVKYAQCYNVYRNSTAGGEYGLVAENVIGTSWSDKDVQYGSSYYYRVKAVNRSVISSQSSYATVNMKIDAPVNVKAVQEDKDGKKVFSVSWDAASYAQGYEVYWCNSINGTYKLVAENVISTTWTDENPAGSNNYYKVCVVCNGERSELSSWAGY